MTVRADSTDLGRILVNLLINAGHAMGEAGVAHPRLTVRARDERDRVVIRVEDNGPGIPPLLRQRIFEPRFTTRKEVGGTGLGLAISRELAAQNNGTLEIDPEYTGGAAFVVGLPAGPLAVSMIRRSA
jgi:two-component system NtrC family sensor kinase